ncbi:MAG: hypothetical protein HYU25_08340 [Candidatus Rokubacteria bacterium]|nr:hypothetical protein [Candidatus Rokubacteria bacterium]
MRLLVQADDGRTVASFEEAEALDYIDYSAEIDGAMIRALQIEGKPLPLWLRQER